MSYIYLQEQGEESSAENFSDIEQFVQSKSKSTPEKSYCNDSETESCHGSQYGTILQRLTVDLGKGKLISFPVGSRVKTFQQQEKALESKGSGRDSGAKWPGWFAKYLPALSLWKTPQCSLLEDYIEFSETWPKWGTMRDGACWELMTPEPLTEGKEFGYLPTPQCRDFRSGQAKRVNRPGKQTNLNDFVKMWPTATKVMYKGTSEASLTRKDGKSREKDLLDHAVLATELHGGTKTRQIYQTPCTQDYRRRGPNSKQQGLPEQIHKMQQWPTPDKNMSARGTQPEWKPKRESGHTAQYTINQAVRDMEKKGQLNPSWVEWLMGWPIEWTALKQLETDKYQQWRRSHLLFYRRG